MADSRRRVMWLLNHSTARTFEVAMLKRLGFTEIFLPKKFPLDVNYRSASIDYTEDAGLSIPEADLAVLNATEWYGAPHRDAWELASRYFDAAFFISWDHWIFSSVARYFKGAAILRAYGHVDGVTYSDYIQRVTGGKRCLEDLGSRFWFAPAYDHLAASESGLLREREVFLPAGLQDCQVRDDWEGSNAAIFFVCPGIEINRYYAEVYREFREHFRDFPYKIGGSQPIPCSDPHVLGFVSGEQHQRNMREFRVMFYHGTESRHVHYTPFEGVRAGMPLIFMAGGLLDRLGGMGLPGRCGSYREARRKIARILKNDRGFIDEIRRSQTRLLDAFRPESTEPAWRSGMNRVIAELDRVKASGRCAPRRRRIGVMLSAAYRGGVLRGAKLLARALWLGSRKWGEDADVVLAYPEAPGQALEPWDVDLPPEISRRNLEWREVSADAAIRAMRFAGHTDWDTPIDRRYAMPDDGVRQMCDCDLWVIVSDRLHAHFLPIRPLCLMAYDYVQRYEAGTAPPVERFYLAAARDADRVLVTTRFTEQDALNYAGVERSRLFRVPMLLPEFEPVRVMTGAEPYFLWATNVGKHKNHLNAITALKQYYEVLDGRLECRITGIEQDNLLDSQHPHLKPLKALIAQSSALRERMQILGDMPEAGYRRQLAGALFLWHPVRVDNGTFSVVEAAALGVRSLSSRYPAMLEMDENLGLNLAWMDAEDPSDMACQLKRMESQVMGVSQVMDAGRRLPPPQLAEHSVKELSGHYWKVIRECL